MSSTDLIGIDAGRLTLQFSALQPELGELTFVIYTPHEGVERRLNLKASVPIERRSVTEVLASKPTEELLDELLGHEARPQRKTIQVEASKLSQTRLDKMMGDIPVGAVLGLCSSSTHRGTKHPVHIPMMDFRLPPSDHNVDLLHKALRRMGFRRGAILDSGRSYHFYGFDLLSREEWWEFMARSLLIAPLTDVRYIGHRLLEGVAILRLTASPLKPKVPVVVDWL